MGDVYDAVGYMSYLAPTCCSGGNHACIGDYSVMCQDESQYDGSAEIDGWSCDNRIASLESSGADLSATGCGSSWTEGEDEYENTGYMSYLAPTCYSGGAHV